MDARIGRVEAPPAVVAVPSEPCSWTFDAVYEAHFPFVWRTARRLSGRHGAVEDVVQDVFLIVHRRLSTFEAKSSIRSWLFTITARVVRDAKRSLHRKPAHLGGGARSSEDIDAIADACAKCPQESAAKTEAMRRLHAILGSMSEQRREVFILAELEQMPVVDIAVAVGANVNTVYSRLRAARAEFEQAVARGAATDETRVP